MTVYRKIPGDLGLTAAPVINLPSAAEIAIFGMAGLAGWWEVDPAFILGNAASDPVASFQFVDRKSGIPMLPKKPGYKPVFVPAATNAVTASTTTGSPNISSVSGGTLLPGQPVTGIAGIPAGTTVVSVSGTTAVLSNAATATATGVTMVASRGALQFGKGQFGTSAALIENFNGALYVPNTTPTIGTQGYSMFIVANPDPAQTAYAFIGNQAALSDGYFAFGNGTSNDDTSLSIRNRSSGSTNLSQASVATPGAFHLYSATYDYTSKLASLRKDGALVVSRSSVATDVTTAGGGDAMVLAATSPVGVDANGFIGQIAAVLMFRNTAITGDNLSTVESYLRAKYAV